jgi:hypothetical protein
MTGLLLWHELTGDRRALRCARRIADLFCRRFLPPSEERLHDTGAHEMNQAPIHALAWLHRLTGEPRYLAMARQIEKEFELPPAGDYLRTALAGQEFFETPKPRWESLHPIMGLSELYLATAEDRYRRAFEHLWWSMLRGDRHNNGGFTSGEKATGNPYDPNPIETCCTVAWMAMSVEMLRLTGNPVVADELELSLFNSGLGLLSPSGRWCTYNTPMEGQRRASAHDIVFQAQPGSPELNCCSVNGPRALGLTAQWAVMRRAEGLALNYYGPGALEAALPSGNRVKLVQETRYPLGGAVTLRVRPRRAESFVLALRIPCWSAATRASVNGKAVGPVEPGTYLELNRRWKAGDTVRLAFDLRPHFWAWRPAQGEKDLELDWAFFGPAPRTEPGPTPDRPPNLPVAPALDGLTAVPRTMTIGGRAYGPVPVRSRGGVIAGRERFPAVGGAPVACGFAHWEVEQEQDVSLCFAADWWIAWYVNGRKVFDNHPGPGNGGDLATRNNAVTIHLRPGRNLIAFHLSGGTSKGCWLSLGRTHTREELEADATRTHRHTWSASVYRGPLLLAFDPRYNGGTPETFPVLDAAALTLRPVQDRTWLKPWLLLETKAADGRKLRLCDFASAGAAGNAYRTWLPVQFAAPPASDFSPRNPLRSVRP